MGVFHSLAPFISHVGPTHEKRALFCLHETGSSTEISIVRLSYTVQSTDKTDKTARRNRVRNSAKMTLIYTRWFRSFNYFGSTGNFPDQDLLLSGRCCHLKYSNWPSSFPGIMSQTAPESVRENAIFYAVGPPVEMRIARHAVKGKY